MSVIQQSPFEVADIPRHASRVFPRRSLGVIDSFIIHQECGTGPLDNVARYHINPNHVCPRGCPGFLYHFGITVDGTIYQCNNLEDATYSTYKVRMKRNRRPSNSDCLKFGKNMNKTSISVMLQGDFDGEGYKGVNGNPNVNQMIALQELTLWVVRESRFKDNRPIPLQNVLGHCHVRKPACPGFYVTHWIEDMVWTGKILESVKTIPALPDDLGEEPPISLIEILKDPTRQAEAADLSQFWDRLGAATGPRADTGREPAEVRREIIEMFRKRWKSGTPLGDREFVGLLELINELEEED